MMDVGAWRAHNDAYLATAVNWLRLRLEIFIAGEQGDGTALDALAERLRDAEASEPPPALVLLAQAFGLTVFERHILLLGIALRARHADGGPVREGPGQSVTALSDVRARAGAFRCARNGKRSRSRGPCATGA